MATDPICGMWVDERDASLRLVRDNRTYYFCSETCLHQFAEPEREQRRLLARLVVAWPLAVGVVVLTYAVPTTAGIVAAAALATVVQIYSGAPFYGGTRDAIRDRSWNMDVLIAVGTSAAFAYSLAALAFPARLPHDYYFDASALIVTLILTGNFLEQRTRGRAGSALRRLEELIPETATVVHDGAARAVPSSQVSPGDRIRVRPGERFPADAQILEGKTSVDESLLIGEPLPQPRGPGDRVLAGSINGEGVVDARATGIGGDTFVAEIGRLLTDAELSRVPLRRTADRIAAVFVPTVLALAVAGGVLWYVAGGASVTVAVLVFVTVAITACPCAFGIATPAAILVGTGRAAESGVVFRGEDSIERAARVDLVLTDKTGTLTRGAPTLEEVVAVEGESTDRVLARAAAVESGSPHPFAAAVVEAARARGLMVPPGESIVVDPGRGVRGRVEGVEVEVARPGPQNGPLPASPAVGSAVERLAGGGASVALVQEGGRTIGVLAFRDRPADGVAEALAALASDGVRVVMVTGDHRAAAESLARSLGIGEVHSEMSPAGKLELLRRFQSEGHVVAFVGDGVNDAPALAGADLGIAIGAGTAVAREAGRVVLVRSDFRGVALALRVARRTVSKVRGNLTWAIGYNGVLLPIALGALVPVFGFSVYAVLPIVGAAAMALSSSTVVANSLSLRRVSLGTTGAAAPGRVTLSQGHG